MQGEDTHMHRAAMCSSANRTRRVIRPMAFGCARMRSAALDYARPVTTSIGWRARVTRAAGGRHFPPARDSSPERR